MFSYLKKILKETDSEISRVKNLEKEIAILHSRKMYRPNVRFEESIDENGNKIIYIFAESIEVN